MKFRMLVVILLGAIAYGVLYHDLPCWAQVLDKTFYCQIKAEMEQDQLETKAAIDRMTPEQRKQFNAMMPPWKRRK